MVTLVVSGDTGAVRSWVASGARGGLWGIENGRRGRGRGNNTFIGIVTTSPRVTLGVTTSVVGPGGTMVDRVTSDAPGCLRGWAGSGSDSSLVLVALRQRRSESETGLWRGSVAPLLDDRLGDTPGVGPGPDADFFGDIQTVLKRFQLGNQLRNMFALPLGLQVTNFFGNLRDELEMNTFKS